MNGTNALAIEQPGSGRAMGLLNTPHAATRPAASGYVISVSLFSILQVCALRYCLIHHDAANGWI